MLLRVIFGALTPESQPDRASGRQVSLWYQCVLLTPIGPAERAVVCEDKGIRYPSGCTPPERAPPMAGRWTVRDQRLREIWDEVARRRGEESMPEPHPDFIAMVRRLYPEGGKLDQQAMVEAFRRRLTPCDHSRFCDCTSWYTVAEEINTAPGTPGFPVEVGTLPTVVYEPMPMVLVDGSPPVLICDDQLGTFLRLLAMTVARVVSFQPQVGFDMSSASVDRILRADRSRLDSATELIVASLNGAGPRAVEVPNIDPPAEAIASSLLAGAKAFALSIAHVTAVSDATGIETRHLPGAPSVQLRFLRRALADRQVTDRHALLLSIKVTNARTADEPLSDAAKMAAIVFSYLGAELYLYGQCLLAGAWEAVQSGTEKAPWDVSNHEQPHFGWERILDLREMASTATLFRDHQADALQMVSDHQHIMDRIWQRSRRPLRKLRKSGLAAGAVWGGVEAD